MVQHPTQARLVGKHPPLRPQEATRDPQRSGMPVIPSYPRANKPDRRGMIMRRQGIPAPFVQMERAPTQHPRLNPGLGKKPFIRKRSATKEFLAQRLGELRSRRMKTAVKSSDLARSRRSAEHSFLSAFQFSVFQLYPLSHFPALQSSPRL